MSLNLELREMGEFCPSMDKPERESLSPSALTTSQPLSERRQAGKKEGSPVRPPASTGHTPGPSPRPRTYLPSGAPLPPIPSCHTRAVDSLSPTLFLTTVTPDGSLHPQRSRSEDFFFPSTILRLNLGSPNPSMRDTPRS